MAIHTHERQRSLPEVFIDLFHQLTALVKNEGQLARAELSEKVDRLAGAGIFLGAGALLVLPGLVLLLVALAYWLAQSGMNPALSSLISGVIALAIGAVLLMVGVNKLKAERLVPNKTIRQIQQDVAVVKEVRQEP